MTAYLVVEAQVDDLSKLKGYQAVVPGLVSKFGGEYIALGGEQESLEGEWGGTRIVIHRWPNREMAKAFWYSEEYEAAKLLRANTGKYRIMLIDGLEKEILEEE